MIRRHPWATAGTVLIALTLATWTAAVNLWWTWQGRNAWGRP